MHAVRVRFDASHCRVILIPLHASYSHWSSAVILTATAHIIPPFLNETLMLPTCPGCKQSVLDDDAEYCPFCGASMKGGKPGKAPASKPAAPKVSPAAAASPAAPAPATKPTKAVAKSSSADAPKAASDDDDPFGVGAASASRAIALSPRPAKGKTTRLLCPMCETQGFAGPEVAGKEVKCCNEKCPLPIFTAPKADGAANASPMPQAAPEVKKSNGVMIMAAVSMVAVAAGSVWFFVLNDPAANIKPAPLPPPTANNPAQIDVTKVDLAAEEKEKANKKVEKPAKERASELRSQILPVMVEISRITENNRSKHYCRRLTAEACVEAGDLKLARENIDQLVKLEPKQLRFHRVIPLTQISWQELSAGNLDAAKAALDEAATAISELPDFGRLTFEVSTDLAALNFAQGRAKEAQVLMQKNSLPAGSSGTLSAVLRRARLLQTFSLDEAASSLPVIPWKSPQWVVTTITLVLRGHADKALAWSKLAPDAETRTDCFAAWGDAIVVAPKSNARENDDLITAAVRDESPSLQARVWARVAAARTAVKQKAAATRAVSLAATSLKSLSLPTNFVLPDMKQMMRLEMPDALQPRLNAIAAAEVVRAQSMLGQTEAAGQTLADAMQHLRGHAPSTAAAQSRFDAIANDSNDVKAQLKKALDLKTEDQVRQSLNQYRAKCRLALDAANARFTLQTEILKSAVEGSLVEAAWGEATVNSAEATPEETREDFLKTNLSVRLGRGLRAAGQDNQARLCETAATNGEFTDPRDTLERETIESWTKGDFAIVARRLIGYQPTKSEGQRTSTEDTDWPLLWAMRLLSRQEPAAKSDKAFEFAAAFTDKLWREEGYELAASLATRDINSVEPLWKKYRSSGLTPTEKIAIFRGLCSGLSAIK